MKPAYMRLQSIARFLKQYDKLLVHSFIQKLLINFSIVQKLVLVYETLKIIKIIQWKTFFAFLNKCEHS